MQRRLWLHLVHDLGVIVEFSGDKGGLEGERSALALDAGSWGGAGKAWPPGLCAARPLLPTALPTLCGAGPFLTLEVGWVRPYFPDDLMRVTRKPGTPREAPSPQHPNTKDQPPPPTVGATPGNRDEQVIGFLGAPHIFGGPHLQRQVPVPRLSPDPVVPGGLVTGVLQAAPPGIPQAPLGSGWTPIMSSPALSILPARVSGVSADTQPETSSPWRISKHWTGW